MIKLYNTQAIKVDGYDILFAYNQEKLIWTKSLVVPQKIQEVRRFVDEDRQYRGKINEIRLYTNGYEDYYGRKILIVYSDGKDLVLEPIGNQFRVSYLGSGDTLLQKGFKSNKVGVGGMDCKKSSEALIYENIYISSKKAYQTTISKKDYFDNVLGSYTLPFNAADSLLYDEDRQYIYAVAYNYNGDSEYTLLQLSVIEEV